jgi:hypothetical protein
MRRVTGEACRVNVAPNARLDEEFRRRPKYRVAIRMLQCGYTCRRIENFVDITVGEIPLRA